jgi:hypothetical protein
MGTKKNDKRAAERARSDLRIENEHLKEVHTREISNQARPAAAPRAHTHSAHSLTLQRLARCLLNRGASPPRRTRR